MKIKVGYRSDPGKIRPNNEDSLLVDADLALFAVADGLGGANAGEIASGMAIDLIHASLKNLITQNLQPKIVNKKYSLPANRLLQAFNEANRSIYHESLKTQKLSGMGTTLTAGLFHEDSLSIAHMGDTRVYRIRDNSLSQITQDHTQAQRLVQLGILTETQVKRTNLSNVLLRALGTEETVKVDLMDTNIKRGDRYLFCSDGLTNMLPDKNILSLILSNDETQKACEALVEAANDAGGLDNITAILAQI